MQLVQGAQLVSVLIHIHAQAVQGHATLQVDGMYHMEIRGFDFGQRIGQNPGFAG